MTRTCTNLHLLERASLELPNLLAVLRHSLLQPTPPSPPAASLRVAQRTFIHLSHTPNPNPNPNPPPFSPISPLGMQSCLLP